MKKLVSGCDQLASGCDLPCVHCHSAPLPPCQLLSAAPRHLPMWQGKGFAYSWARPSFVMFIVKQFSFLHASCSATPKKPAGMGKSLCLWLGQTSLSHRSIVVRAHSQPAPLAHIAHPPPVICAPPWQSALLVTCIWPKPARGMAFRKVVAAASRSPDADIPLDLPSHNGHNLCVMLLHPIRPAPMPTVGFLP